MEKSPANTRYGNHNSLKLCFVLLLLVCFCIPVFSQQKELLNNNVIWATQSRNSSESMPVGGGDIGVNVWVEAGEVYLYLSRSGTFDENNTLLKLGRVKLSLSPNPFAGKTFKQELVLKDGYVLISGEDGKLNTQIKVWVDVFKPVVNIEIEANRKVLTAASYESWRFEDRMTKGKENNQNSYKWAPQGIVKTTKDEIDFRDNQIEFSHQNAAETVFDVAVRQQGLAHYQSKLYHPLKGLKFGGSMQGKNMVASGTYSGKYLSTAFKGWTLKSRKPVNKQQISIALY
ncbi:MAG: DUF5703 domain-containing protein, partial [Pedobacter sp.]|nr:DUF5703 domain-containing protein [Pedobacter sp.]